MASMDFWNSRTMSPQALGGWKRAEIVIVADGQGRNVKRDSRRPFHPRKKRMRRMRAVAVSAFLRDETTFSASYDCHQFNNH
jgi:hypothetical protein